ncbi:unnamed protein product [marine sediment metagenome]|uniref:Uncharacterized protein n=1 Tax=marine sediment metagenome TaxID=412755 RepID=X1G1S5_9ZZZZ
MKSKKGQVGLEGITKFIVGALVLAVTVIAVFLALTSLQNAGIFTAGSQAANDTDLIIGNVTTGATQFFTFIPTILTLLGVVLLMIAIAVLIVVVRRAGGAGTGGGL